jgi:hypothetical protein
VRPETCAQIQAASLDLGKLPYEFAKGAITAALGSFSQWKPLHLPLAALGPGFRLFLEDEWIDFDHKADAFLSFASRFHPFESS